MDIVILGLSISSSWGNGHATIYRALVRECVRRGHRVLFLEREKEWYASHRDLPADLREVTAIYPSLDTLAKWKDRVALADLVIVGSYVPDGVAVGRWAREIADGALVFYDIDTPITLAKLEEGDEEYLSADLVPQYDIYLSFTAGPVLREVERRWGSPRAEAFYCTADLERYRPAGGPVDLDLGYLGTYSPDRQAALESLLIEPARRWPEGRFAVFGPQFPESIAWPANIALADHLDPEAHPWFFGRQRFTLNVTRANMVRAGYSPSVRLFEAAACGTPIISDWWEGLDSIFEPEDEILIARSGDDTLRYLRDITEEKRRSMGWRLRARVEQEHSPARRIDALEQLVREVRPRAGVAAGN